jgi:tetratricopeptide (TPR) repeat protein
MPATSVSDVKTGDVETDVRFGEFCAQEDLQSQAISNCTKAVEANPLSASAHAQLGYIYASQGERKKAIVELKEAERLVSSEDVNMEKILCEAYTQLHEIPSVILHCEKIVKLAKDQDLSLGLIKSYENNLLELKARLTPTFFTIIPPTDYTKRSLIEAFQQKLTPEESTLITNPLVSTPEMNRWARELSAGASNDLQRAQVLFDALIIHVDQLDSRTRTAQEVFSTWNTPGISLHCRDYAYLYVAMARAIGLKAYYVEVQEACDGQRAFHSCAAVFIGTKALLVDPAYFWFGAPHKHFRILNDLETTAEYLSSLHDLKCCQIAAKLAPDILLVQQNLLDGLINENRWQEGDKVLQDIVRLDPNDWVSDFSQAEFAFHAGHLEKAINLLQKANEISPYTGAIYLLLGRTYLEQGNFIKARASFLNALNCILDEEYAEQARQAIANIDKTISGHSDHAQLFPDVNVTNADYYYRRGYYEQKDGSWDSALADFNKAIELKPDFAEAYCARGVIEQMEKNLSSALFDYNRAIELKPDSAQAYNNRGYLEQLQGDLDGAANDYSKVIELDPKFNSNIAIGFRMLGCLYYDRRQFTNALTDFRKVCELAPSDDYAHFRIWLVRSRLGEIEAAATELQIFLDNRKTGKPDDWPAKVARFLVGQLTEPELFKAAECSNQQTEAKQNCEAYFYAGAKRLLTGDKTTAAAYFEKCLATGLSDSSEYQSAAAELKYLKRSS